MFWFLWNCDKSPCRLTALFNLTTISLMATLVLLKIIVFPSVLRLLMSYSMISDLSTPYLCSTAKCSMVTDVLYSPFDLPTKLMIYLSFMYFSLMVITHGGIVAENISICLYCSFSWDFLMLFTIYSISSWNPMFNILSASSRQIVSMLERFITPLLIWSWSLPGVPIIISAPDFKLLTWSRIESPP